MYGVEYMKYWPRWMNVRYPPSSGSLLATFYLASWLEQYANLTRDLDDYRGGRLYGSWGQIRLGWIVYLSELPSKDISIVFSCPAGTGTASRAVTLYDFAHSTSPVFFLDSSGAILLRNLEVTEVLTTPSSDFTVSLEPLVPDTDVWWKTGREFERLPCQSSNLDNSNGILHFPFRSPVLLRYSSQSLTNSLDSSGSINIDGGPPIPLSKLDLFNTWDNTGSIRDLVRLPREDNYNYFLRQKSCYYIKGGTQLPRLESAIARSLDLITSFQWTPTGAVSLPSLGIIDAVEVVVYGLAKNSLRVENLRKISDNIYIATKIPTAGTLRVSVGGFSTHPVSSVDNIITFFNPPNDAAQASYGYESYTVTRDSSGYITLLAPVSGNIDAGREYTVYVSRSVIATTLSSPGYHSRLYNPSGGGTDYFFNLASDIVNSVRVTLGKVQWEKAVWFTDDDVKPELTYVPRILDNGE